MKDVGDFLRLLSYKSSILFSDTASMSIFRNRLGLSRCRNLRYFFSFFFLFTLAGVWLSFNSLKAPLFSFLLLTPTMSQSVR